METTVDAHRGQDIPPRRLIGIRVESPEEVEPAIEKANDIDDRPVVIEFRTDSREKVFPMVPAGLSNDEIITFQSHKDVVQ